MSSLRNALPRRNHKERGQLPNRARLGLLEKHKDYVLRARDYHAKQARIQRLRVKAAERNKDEFYFGMARSRTEAGVHVQEREGRALPTEVVRLLKSQDAGYVRAQRAANRRKIETIKAELMPLVDLVPSAKDFTSEQIVTLRAAGLLSAAVPKPKNKKTRSVSRTGPRHVVFAENAEEATSYRPPSTAAPLPEADSDADEDAAVVSDTDTSPSDLGWLPSSPSPAPPKPTPSSSAHPPPPTPTTPSPSPLLTELRARLHRERQLTYALSEIELQRALMGKGGRRKVREAEEVRDTEGEGDGEEEEEEGGGEGGGKEKGVWRPRVFKWRAVRRK